MVKLKVDEKEAKAPVDLSGVAPKGKWWSAEQNADVVAHIFKFLS